LLIGLATIAVLGVSAQWLAWRLAVPSILLLLIAGLAAGPLFGVLVPDELLGDLLFPVVSMSVALILFEGGLSLRLADLPRVGGVVRSLVTVGALVTWAVSTLGALLLFDISPPIAVLLGAVLVVTGPTVIGPLLQNIRPTGPCAAVLRWEGIVIDPIGATLAVLVFEVIAVGDVEAATTQVISGLTKTVVFGGGLGLLAAALLTVLLRRYWIPDYLQNATSLMFIIAAFVTANHVQHESGLLAVTVMGVALANQKLTDVRHIVEFKENLRVLLISAVFILLSARLQPAELKSVIGAGIVYVGLLIVVARPLATLVCTVKSRLPKRDRLFIASLAPRGIIAAAVSSVFAFRLEQIGYESARLLVPITFIVIIGTVAVYGLASPFVARRLGVADPNPQGIVFVGAQPWVRKLAQTLHEKNIRVLLADTNRNNTSAARMAGLPAYSGSLLADHALDTLDLGGIGRLFAVTPNEWVNALTVQRFSRILGRNECYQIVTQRESKARPAGHGHLWGRPLFQPQADYLTLQTRLSAGATFKATSLSESFDFEAFRAYYGEDAIPMFLLDDNGRLTVITADKEVKPKPGHTVIGLVHDRSQPPAARKQRPGTPARQQQTDGTQ
jgi:NhaP-type Na+/H+ or K+/H+ antiporter